MTDIQILIDLEQYRNDIKSHYGNAAKELIEVGRLLKEVKNNLPEDTSFNAFAETLPFSRRSAYHYLKLHEHYLRHGSAIVALENVNIDVWYALEPDSALVDKVIEKAQKGHKVTKQDMQAITERMSFENSETAHAWHEAAASNPQFVLESFQRKAVVNLDGHDIPLHEADPTLIRINAIEDEFQRLRRQQHYIQDNAKPKREYALKTQAVRDNHGVIAIGVIIPDLELNDLNLDLEVSVYLPETKETEQVKGEAA